jgi:hypothetical protein
MTAAAAAPIRSDAGVDVASVPVVLVGYGEVGRIVGAAFAAGGIAHLRRPIR